MRILSVGSSVIDLFLTPDIDLQSTNSVTLNLGDKIPTDFTGTSVGGNAANVAVVLKRLGIDAPLYTYLAKDFLSKEIELGLEEEGIEPIAERVKGKSDFSAILRFGQDRIVFSHHDECAHAFNFTRTPPDVIYLTSIGNTWEEAYTKVKDYAQTHNATLAFSPGSQQLKNLNSTFYEVLQNSEIFFSNLDEARKVINEKFPEVIEIKEVIAKLHTLGPKVISITNGAEGSYASDEQNTYKLGIIPDKYVEKTGAGDTYAASFLAWYTFTKDLKASMRAGAINASAVMKKVGAHEGILTKTQLEDKMKEHTSLQPEEI